MSRGFREGCAPGRHCVGRIRSLLSRGEFAHVIGDAIEHISHLHGHAASAGRSRQMVLVLLGAAKMASSRARPTFGDRYQRRRQHRCPRPDSRPIPHASGRAHRRFLRCIRRSLHQRAGTISESRDGDSDSTHGEISHCPDGFYGRGIQPLQDCGNEPLMAVRSAADAPASQRSLSAADRVSRSAPAVENRWPQRRILRPAKPPQVLAQQNSSLNRSTPASYCGFIAILRYRRVAAFSSRPENVFCLVRPRRC